jgi:hypothetical protein
VSKRFRHCETAITYLSLVYYIRNVTTVEHVPLKILFSFITLFVKSHGSVYRRCKIILIREFVTVYIMSGISIAAIWSVRGDEMGRVQASGMRTISRDIAITLVKEGISKLDYHMENHNN